MPDQKPILEIKIFHEGEGSLKLKVTGYENLPIRAVFNPLGIFVNNMMDAMDKDRNATMQQLMDACGAKEEAQDV